MLGACPDISGAGFDKKWRQPALKLKIPFPTPLQKNNFTLLWAKISLHMEYIMPALLFLWNVLTKSFSQFFWLFGMVMILGIILFFLARFTRKMYALTLGHTAELFTTAWLGTPIHELGHAFFCLIFRHEIKEIKLFSPDASDGTLGFVKHAYNSKSIYQRIGLLFIGVGPVLFGSAVIALSYYFLVSTDMQVLSLANFDFITTESESTWYESIAFHLLGIWQVFASLFEAIFTLHNASTYTFWIFIFITVSVSAHMELSLPDLNSARSGIIALLVFMLFHNFIVLLLESFSVHEMFGGLWNFIQPEYYSHFINRFKSGLNAIMILAILFSALNFVFTYGVLGFYSLLRYKKWPNPFGV